MSLKIDQHFAELLQQFNGSFLVVAVFYSIMWRCVCVCVLICLQHFDAFGWATERAFAL